MISRYFADVDFDAAQFHPNHRNISALDILLRVHLNPRAGESRSPGGFPRG